MTKQSEERSGVPDPAGGKPRVLIVDDHEDTAQFLADWLELSGYSARAVNDGPTALRIAQTFQPHVVLLDIGLPVMDGYDLAKRMRELPEVSAARLVAFTGRKQDAQPRHADRVDFDEYLMKPVDPVRVEAVIRRLLSPRPLLPEGG
jgi:CheY-like chemotaxis protein